MMNPSLFWPVHRCVLKFSSTIFFGLVEHNSEKLFLNYHSCCFATVFSGKILKFLYVNAVNSPKTVSENAGA